MWTMSNTMTALIVDDDPVNRRMHRMLLNNLGVETKEAENGEEAVGLCSSGAVFDLILMDKEMPVMDGLTATRQLRSIGVVSKIVGVSGDSHITDQHGFIDAGVDDFQIKPLTRAKLVPILQQLEPVERLKQA